MKSYQLALVYAAMDAYQSEIVETEMEHLTIGKNNEYPTVFDWMMERMNEWLEKAGGNNGLPSM